MDVGTEQKDSQRGAEEPLFQRDKEPMSLEPQNSTWGTAAVFAAPGIENRRPTLLSILAVTKLVQSLLLAITIFHQTDVAQSWGRTTVFNQDPTFMSLDRKFDHQWHELAEETSGIIWSHEGQFETGGIAMFHQLHCLIAMRTAMQAGLEGRLSAVDSTDDGHWPHCMDYLRQVIICHADGTIERPREVEHLPYGKENWIITDSMSQGSATILGLCTDCREIMLSIKTLS